ncbi:hypothetical protein C2G38_2167980 [Gigaspora rosea]|uniref:Uncharacterized protein n=1 Tax=Gigaspora rosea TaxID=44941 RepID=A0A397VTI9_9GLOM|nr:hypothetical protein C2G38_2167980 [Gigaspora rosea]
MFPFLTIQTPCSPDILIPSAQWFKLLFWPKNTTYKSSIQYTGRLSLKFMVQSRQLRADHPDAHYASALFRYKKEFAIKFRNFTTLAFLDNKHQCKISKPGYPIVAVEKGKQVIVNKNVTFAISDHDFTKTGMVPSITMLCSIPKTIDGNFYAGQVNIGLKDPIFQPFSPLCHMTELYDILLIQRIINPILCLYIDSGPNHRCTYMQVQLSYICLFLALNLNYLVTPPQHSWKNPVERVMSTLNLGLQCIGLMHTKMNEKYEKLIKKTNSMKEIREVAESNPILKEELIKSIQDPISLVCEPFEALYGTTTTEKYRPSCREQIPIVKSNQQKGRKKGEVKCLFAPHQYMRETAKKLNEKDHQMLVQFLDTILYTCGTTFNKTCKLSTTIPTRQRYESDENNDNAQSEQNKQNEQSKQSEQSDQDNYKINEANDFYSKEHKQNKEDEINDPI